jgi:hypothetical protein
VAKQLFDKRKPALLLTLGTAAGLIVGGGIALWLTQHQPIADSPLGTEIVPQDAALSLSFSTNQGQWDQLKRFGTPEAQAALGQNLTKLRDRFLTGNGLNYQSDIQPWVGREVTVAFLLPPAPADAKSGSQQVQPYTPPDSTKPAESAVAVMPIASPEKAQQFMEKTKGNASAVWADRDYKGARIREVHNDAALAYAVTNLDNHFVVISKDEKAVERVVDTYRGSASVLQVSGYRQAFTQLNQKQDNPILRLYLNVPAARSLTTNNPLQPVPPLSLTPLQNNQGTVAEVTVQSDGVRVQGVSWLASDSKLDHKVVTSPNRMLNLLPAESLLMASGGNLKEFWQDYSQPIEGVPNRGLFDPNNLRQGLTNFTGLDLDRDLIPWMEGEYAMALVSAPGTANSPDPRTGIVLMVQASDRNAADQTYQKLDGIMKDRYHFRVSEGQVNGKPVINWVSPFSALTVSRGWLDNNIAFLAVGNGLASTILPAPDKPLAADDLFKTTTSTDLNSNNGHFFVEVERLVAPVTNLPLPILPPENRAFLSSIQAIGVTSAIQDSRTTRYDVHVSLRKFGDTPESPAVSPSSTEVSPNPAASQ